jgi:hypothetical protein
MGNYFVDPSPQGLPSGEETWQRHIPHIRNATCSGRPYLWILIRKTNDASLRFAGIHGFYPKPIECKAKTANNEKATQAGLVVAFDVIKKAKLTSVVYKEEKLARAEAAWQKFLVHLKVRNSDELNRRELRYRVQRAGRSRSALAMTEGARR